MRNIKILKIKKPPIRGGRGDISMVKIAKLKPGESAPGIAFWVCLLFRLTRLRVFFPFIYRDVTVKVHVDFHAVSRKRVFTARRCEEHRLA